MNFEYFYLQSFRPIIQEPTAKLLGMEISLLERYAAQMTMLQIQYRMVRDIIQYGRGGKKLSIMVPPPFYNTLYGINLR